jgi:hypothetical protein
LITIKQGEGEIQNQKSKINPAEIDEASSHRARMQNDPDEIDEASSHRAGISKIKKCSFGVGKVCRK